MSTNTKESIIAALRKNLAESGSPEFELTLPKLESHGDLATSVALRLAKELGQSPLEIAEQIVAKLGQIEGVAKIEVAPPGFINFTLTDKALIEALRQAINPETGWPKFTKFSKAVVEYSSPNIAKPFSIGHLRSTIIGDAVANLLEVLGVQVFRDNHLGDLGTQFGKQIYAIKTWGDEAALETAPNKVKALVALYIKFHEEADKNPALENEARAWSKKLEDGDPEARRLWQKCVDWSWQEFAKLYERLGVKFTENDGRGYGEAFFEDKMAPVIAELEADNLLKESEGAKLVFFPNDALPPMMILRNDGGSLYATRDLATDKFRLGHYGQDITVINETGVEQELHFRQLFKIETILGWYKPGQRIHIKHGHWRFKDRKMATRKGDVIWLSEVLNEAKTRALELIKTSGTAKAMNAAEQDELAEIIGIGALKWNDLKSSPQLNIVFDWDEVLNMDGNSAPYVQYTCVRAKSILTQATPKSLESQIPATRELSPGERALIRCLAQYKEVVLEAAENYAPYTLCNYLYGLAQSFNGFYQTHPVLKAQEDLVAVRLALTAATAATLVHGLKILGIKTPARM